MAGSDNLVPLLTPKPGGSVGFRQGVLTDYNPETAENTVLVGGGVLTNVPILAPSTDALALEAGAVVGLLTSGSSWFIAGRIVIPGSADAVNVLTQFSRRIVADQVLGTTSTTTNTYGSLSGPVVGAYIGRPGRALVMISASLNYGTASIANIEGGEISVDVTGATTRPPGSSSEATDTFNINTTSTRDVQLTRFVVMEGLNPGPHTFTHMIRSRQNGRSCNFDRRALVVFAL